MPYLVIQIAGSDGSGAEHSVATAIKIAIPKELSKRVAALHVLEYAGKELRRYAISEALAGIGRTK